ncbi:MAG: hypothetical protein LBG31_00665 [Prevotellaceae bacterium]|jgi:hypothetical protein|nr:hypothetical protein [Prevotellaceae bacterium]
MKKIKLYFSAVLTAGLMLFTACEKDAIDPLEGKYPVPENYALAGLVSQNVAKETGARIFTLELGSAGQYLSVEFAGPRANYLLPAGNYTIAARSAARAGNYIAGDGNGGTYWVTGSTKLKLIDGTIAVQVTGDTYTISGIVMLEDRSIIKIAYTGVIIFAPDPPVYTYTLDVQKPYAWTADGTTFSPVSGSQLNKFTVLADGDKVAYIEIVTAENPASFSGTYPVSGAIRDASGAVVQGLYMDLSAFVPGLIIEGGSYLFDSENQYINAGNITIADNGGVLTFTSSDLAILDKATGLPKPGTQSINYAEATNATVQASYTYSIETAAPAMGGMMGTDPIAGSQLNKISVFSGSDLVAYFELVSAENPASLSGDYVVTDGISAIGQAANGYQLPSIWGGASGGCYYIANGEKMFIRAGGGNISITDNNGVLTITGSNLPILDVAAVESSSGTNWATLPDAGSVNYQNVAPAGNGSGGNAVTLTNVLSAAATDLAAVSGGALTGYTVTLKIGEAGLTATPNMFGGLDFSGTGKYVSIDFSRDAGTLIPGTYNIVDNTTATVGDAIAGYYLDFGGFGFNSGCMWVSVEGGVPTETFITGGTVVVTESSGAYTITVNAATAEGNVNAVYTGPITIQ